MKLNVLVPILSDELLKTTSKTLLRCIDVYMQWTLYNADILGPQRSGLIIEMSCFTVGVLFHP